MSDWEDDPIPGVVSVPFDPPLSLPLDLISSPSPTEEAELLVRTGCLVRDEEGRLTRKPARTELPEN